ncbi:hypothetical protein PQX77_013198 [Marasmius sp. AFHP31]|nr:hypothetical protein PQX77_013198 [Marasmius sp. AFHP31]
MAGLAPTLIIVRVAHGKSVDSVQQMMSIHFANQDASQQSHGESDTTATLHVRSYFRNRASDVDIEAAKPEELSEDKKT